jgi:hypothetical protein
MAIDVASWLQQLDLAQYEPAFRDNEVDGDVLPDLTAEDLIGLGVTLIGHRPDTHRIRDTRLLPRVRTALTMGTRRPAA